MKKALSILMLVIFSFNLGGYYLFFNILKESAHIELIKELDNNQYSPDQLIELKIPISLPYAINSEDYKRVNGRFEYKGNIYKLVKQKFENDTLYIVCIKDHREKKLIYNFKEYAKNTNDTPGTSSKKESHRSLKQINKDYFGQCCISLSDRGCILIINNPSFNPFHQSSIGSDVPTPPPQA